MYRIVVASAPDPRNRYCVQLAKPSGRKAADGSFIYPVVYGPDTYKRCKQWIDKQS